MKGWTIALAVVGLSIAAAGRAADRWDERTLPDLDRGESAVQLLALDERDGVRMAELQTLRIDAFDGGWESDLRLYAGGSLDRGDRQLRLIRFDEDCRRSAARTRQLPERWCDQLLVQVGRDALSINYQSPETDTSFQLQLWPSPDEPGVWRAPRLGLDGEPQSIAVELQRHAQFVQASWWIDATQLPHFTRLQLHLDLLQATGLSEIEASLLGLADLAATLADFEGPAPIELPLTAQRQARAVQGERGPLLPRDPWPQCVDAPQACGLPDLSSCSGFHCGLCERAPAGSDQRSCLATLYGTEIGPEDPPDTVCFLFVCWSQNDGDGGGVGGGGGGNGGGSGGVGISDFAPYPDCVSFDGDLWEQNPFDKADLALRDGQRKLRPFVIFLRESGHVEVINAVYNNLGCGSQGLNSLVSSRIREVFLNEERIVYGELAWRDFYDFDLQFGYGSPNGFIGAGRGSCAAFGTGFPLENIVGAGLAMAQYTLGFNRILNAQCKNLAPYADYPMEYDYRVRVHLTIDPYDALDEDDESNNTGTTRNWVKLRRPR